VNKLKILADASLPHLDDLFGEPFQLTRYSTPKMREDALPNQDILLCRSTLKVTPELLKNTHLSCVATASSGIDHIDTSYLDAKNIALFDAKGCNAEAVADYMLATFAYLHMHHSNLSGKCVGVMGAGEVGMRVIKRLEALNFKVLAYDPLKPNFKSCRFEAFQACDILCIHANLHNTAPHPTKNSLDANFLNQLKPNTMIINAARGGILNEQALLDSKKNIIYCTDVYQNEPEINPSVIQYATLCTPHIAGHSIEAKSNAVLHLSQKLHTHFNLAPPESYQNTRPIPSNSQQTWDALALSLYNPIIETEQLKKAVLHSTAFLDLRRAHQYRHDFNWNAYKL
jgi:erythronate-4-phosphate dehydrogenase